MKGSFDRLAMENASLEIDPKMVRGEAIRAIRGFTIRSDQPSDRLVSRPRPVSFYAIVRIMRDLELTLMAISGSLAEGIEHVTDGSRAPSEPSQPPKGRRIPQRLRQGRN